MAKDLSSYFVDLKKEFEKGLPPDALDLIVRLIDRHIDMNFARGGRVGNGTGFFDGGNTPWKALAKSTQKSYAKQGRSLKPTLEYSGALIRSVSVVRNGRQINVSANLPYAAIHQYGGTIDVPTHKRTIYFKIGKDGKPYFVSPKKKGKKGVIDKTVTVPAYKIDIPARPYLNINQDGINQIIDIVRKYYGIK